MNIPLFTSPLPLFDCLPDRETIFSTSYESSPLSLFVRQVCLREHLWAPKEGAFAISTERHPLSPLLTRSHERVRDPSLSVKIRFPPAKSQPHSNWWTVPYDLLEMVRRSSSLWPAESLFSRRTHPPTPCLVSKLGSSEQKS